MPIIVLRDYEWRQTDDCVIIQVDVKVAPKNVDLVVIDDYMKVYFKPFILEIFLWASVKDEESFCTISENQLTFTLKKLKSGIEWVGLETPELTKEMKKERRDQAMKLRQTLNEEKRKNKAEKKSQLRRKATQAQLDLQTEMINKIDNIKDECRKQAMNELDEWSKKSSIPCLEDKPKKINDKRSEFLNETSLKEDKGRSEENENNEEDSCNIWDSFDSDSDAEETKQYKPGEKTVREIISGRRLSKKPLNDAGQVVPLPRESGTIQVTFSDRVFVTPARESVKDQEDEWLAKQAKARRSTGFVAEDLRPEEQDPQWCLDKGEDFMKVGNYLGAISAFTHGIKLNDKLEDLYIKRSSAQYAIENYHRCIEDASKALELMVPECESNREARARCYARRGAAFCQLSAPQHGLPELEAALKLLPDDVQIKTDIQKIKNHFNLN